MVFPIQPVWKVGYYLLFIDCMIWYRVPTDYCILIIWFSTTKNESIRVYNDRFNKDYFLEGKSATSLKIGGLRISSDLDP